MNKYTKMTQKEKTEKYVKPILSELIKTLKLIDEGTMSGKWVKPFEALTRSMQSPNKLIGGTYGLYNSMACLSFQEQFNYEYNLWGTYKQIQSLGGRIKKGETASNKGQYLYKMYDIVKKDEETEETKKFGGMSWYCVFNIDQTEGLDHLKVKPQEQPKPKSKITEIPEIETYIKNTGIKIESNTEGRCYYSPTQDYISMSDKASWKKIQGLAVNETEIFYATMFHEMAHATGHKSRLDRLDNFGYAFEELVAELSSAINCAKFGIASALQPNHAQYIKSWIKQLDEKPNTLLKACALATKTIDWLDNQQ